LRSVKAAQDNGFTNLSIDLIYGTPTLSNEQWIRNLEQAFSLHVPHLSCYSLTVEPQTVLAHQIKKGKVKPLDETRSAEQFELLMQLATANGFEQYEISNFAKDKKYSRHNSSYWQNEKYLGLGPSAHSYNGHSRQWNAANNALYIEALDKDKIPFEREELTLVQQYNEYMLTSLRTSWGCNIETIRQRFGESFAEKFLQSITGFVKETWVVNNGKDFLLTGKGKFFADKISAELFQ